MGLARVEWLLLCIGSCLLAVRSSQVQNHVHFNNSKIISVSRKLLYCVHSKKRMV